MSKSGFTLIEIIVAVTIIALLSVASLTGFSQQQLRSRESRRISDVSTVGIALENYRLAKSSYPAATPYDQNGYWFTDTRSHLTDLTSGGFLSVLPSEPKPISGGERVCTNYTYVSDWQNNNTNYGPIKFNDQLISAPRSWAISFRTEMTDSTSHHPLDSSIYTSPTQSFCNYQSGYGWLLSQS